MIAQRTCRLGADVFGIATGCSRTQHATPGLVCGHFDLHEGIAADLVMDTTTAAPEAAAELILRTPIPAAGAGALHAR